MSARRTTAEPTREVFEVEWPMFGELSRALALRVVRGYDPEIVIGIATEASSTREISEPAAANAVA